MRNKGTERKTGMAREKVKCDQKRSRRTKTVGSTQRWRWVIVQTHIAGRFPGYVVYPNKDWLCKTEKYFLPGLGICDTMKVRSLAMKSRCLGENIMRTI